MPDGSSGVMVHEAVPVASVVAVQVSDPFSWSVTDSPEMGAFVLASFSTAETVTAFE